MDNSQKAKRILRKYKLQEMLAWSAVVLLYLSVYLLAIYSKISPLIALMGLIVVLYVRNPISKLLFYDRINQILIRDLDVELYLECIHAGNIQYISGMERLIPAVLTGDYQNAVNICADRSADPRCTKIGWSYLVQRAGICFVLDDRDGLKAICDEFDHMVKYSKNGANIRHQASVFHFYRSYLEGNTATCDQYLHTVRESDSATNHDHLITDFLAGLLHYRTGDVDRAKMHFEAVIRCAPHLYPATIAQAHLKAMESGENYVISTPAPIPTSDYVSPQMPRAVRRRRIVLQIISGVVIAILFVFLLALSITHYSQENMEDHINSAYTDAVRVHYADAEILDQFLLQKNGETIENMCVVQTANGTLVVGCLYTYNDDDLWYFDSYLEIKPNMRYCSSGSVSGAMISFALTDDKAEIPDGVYYSVMLETTQGTLYFYVDDIVDLNDYFPPI